MNVLLTFITFIFREELIVHKTEKAKECLQSMSTKTYFKFIHHGEVQDMTDLR